MEDDAAHQLDVEVAHVEDALPRLPDDGKRLREEVVERLAVLDPLAGPGDLRGRPRREAVPGDWPVRGTLSSVFGVRNSPFPETPVFHHGLDIVARAGAPVQASASGVVVKSGYESLYGNLVIVDHGAGDRTAYAQLSSRSVEEGAFVNRGEELGKVGSTGRSTGPHLHYEVRVNGLPGNPARFLH